VLGIWTSEFERNWGRKSKLVMYGIFIVLVMINIWGMHRSLIGEYRYGEGTVFLNNLNTPWFVMNGVTLFLVAALLPAIYIEHMSGELNSGTYRLYAIRPFKRSQLWLGKLLALTITTTILVLITYGIAMISAEFLFPAKETTRLYSTIGEVGRKAAEWYTIKFYILFLLTCFAKLMFCSAICVFVRRPLVAFLLTLAIGVILYKYVMVELVVLFDPFQQILLALRPEGSPRFWIALIGSIAIFTGISFVGWQKKVI